MLLFTCCKYVADLLLTTTQNFTYNCFYAWGHCVGKGFTNEHYLKFCYRYTVSKLHPQILGFSSYYDSNTSILLIGHLRDTCQLACRSVSMSGVRSGRRKRRGTFPLASFVKYTILFIDCFSIMVFVGILYLHFMPNLVKYWPKCGHIKVRQPGFGVGIKTKTGQYCHLYLQCNTIPTVRRRYSYTSFIPRHRSGLLPCWLTRQFKPGNEPVYVCGVKGGRTRDCSMVKIPGLSRDRGIKGV